jgi:hypothetical protein
METNPSFLRRLPYPILAIGFALTIGLVIPPFYEWSNGSQILGRELKLLRATFLTLAITLVVSAIGFWRNWQIRHTLSAPEGDDPVQPIRKIQFSIRGQLIVTTLVAILLAVAPLFATTWQGTVTLVLIFAILGWAIFIQRSAFIRTLCWLGVTYLPFVWVIPFSKPFGSVSGMIDSLPVFPALIPAMILSRIIGHHTQDGPALFIVAVTALIAGFFVMRRGGKLSTVTIALAFVSAILGSMLLHVMYRV